jgi:hypothetical protein
MIEFTFTEVILFAWGMVATAYAFKYNHDAEMAKFFVHKIITDESVRNDLVAAHAKFVKEST